MLNSQLDFTFFEKSELKLIFRKLNREAKFRYSIFLQILTIALLVTGFAWLALFFQLIILNQENFFSINLLLFSLTSHLLIYYLLLHLKTLQYRFLRHYLDSAQYKKSKEIVLLNSPAFMLLTKNRRLHLIASGIISKTTQQELSVIETLINDQYRGSVRQLLDIAQKV